jgi:hypothetical protein
MRTNLFASIYASAQASTRARFDGYCWEYSAYFSHATNVCKILLVHAEAFKTIKARLHLLMVAMRTNLFASIYAHV